ncbi:MAG: ORF6N domain-containing protein [Ruminococcus sp.]|nr:ORF6N domain-containing protein [Ruminococcus sp.]
MYELINNMPLQIKEYNGQRVVTFKDIDRVHNRPEGTAGRNFRKNRQHFIEGEDFFVVNQPDEIRRLGITRHQGGTPSNVILITENGYLMLVKSFTDKLAWDVQRQLVNTYFKAMVINNSYDELLKQLHNEINFSVEETVNNVLDKKLKVIVKELNKNSKITITEAVSETAKSLVTYFDALIKILHNIY